MYFGFGIGKSTAVIDKSTAVESNGSGSVQVNYDSPGAQQINITTEKPDRHITESFKLKLINELPQDKSQKIYIGIESDNEETLNFATEIMKYLQQIGRSLDGPYGILLVGGIGGVEIEYGVRVGVWGESPAIYIPDIDR